MEKSIPITACAMPRVEMPRVEWKLIGPSEAMAILERSHEVKSRPVQDTRVTRMADDMVNGRWLATGATIKLTRDGKLLDGQHRLWGVVQSGVSIWFLVARGIDEAAMTAIDIGASRSLGDFLRMKESPNHFAVAAVVNKLWRWDHRATFYKAAGSRGDIPTMQQALTYYAEHKVEIDHSVSQTRRVGLTSLGFSGVSAATHVIFSRISPTDTEDYFIKLESGARLGVGDGILLLRTRLQAIRADHSKPVDGFVAALFIKAWNAYRRGRPLLKLSYQIGGATPETFPKPV